jgi:hypothetical protein
VRIKLGGIAERLAFQKEPSNWTTHDEIDFGTIQSDMTRSISFTDTKPRRFLDAHCGQGVNQPTSIFQRAGTTPAIGIARFGVRQLVGMVC